MPVLLLAALNLSVPIDDVESKHMICWIPSSSNSLTVREQTYSEKLHAHSYEPTTDTGIELLKAIEQTMVLLEPLRWFPTVSIRKSLLATLARFVYKHIYIYEIKLKHGRLLFNGKRRKIETKRRQT